MILTALILVLAAGRLITGTEAPIRTIKSLTFIEILPGELITLGRKVICRWPTAVMAFWMSVKMAFQSELAMILPGTALVAAAGAV